MLLPIVYAVLFCAVNVFIWSLPLSTEKLFAVTLPLGVAYFWSLFRVYRPRG